MIVAVAITLGSLVALALAYQSVGALRDRRRFPPRGRMVSIPRGRLHIVEQGSGTPAVILEAGLAASSLSWSYVQPLVARFASVVSYDRAGLGSSQASTRRTLDRIVADLKGLLEAAQIPGPYILVGHSFGGLLIRAFAHTYPELLAGLVFVDPVSIESWANCSDRDRYRLGRGVALSRRGARLAQFGIVRLAIAAASLRSKRVTQAIAKASAGKATPMLGRLVGEVGKLPPELIPIVRAHWSNPKSFRGMAEYLACLPECAEQAQRMPIPQNVPFIVLSAASATEAEMAEREEWVAGRSNARHTQVPGTGHWLHLERPDIVAGAVKELVDRYRSMGHGIDDVVDPDAKSEC